MTKTSAHSARRRGALLLALVVLAVSGLVSTPSAGATAPRQWRHPYQDPAGAAFPGMAYDEAARRTVLFGGFLNYHALQTYRTSTWDGRRWQVSTAGDPPGRQQVAMIYDPARKQVLLFGGAMSSAIEGDTWIWNGLRWSKAGGAGPPARYGASLVFDAATRDVVLFGGCCDSNNQPFGDTWTWDGRAWHRRLGPAPPARLMADFAYDPATGQAVLVGGMPASIGYALGDTWIWTGSAWRRSPAELPRREHSVLVYDAASRQLVLFGGDNGGNPLRFCTAVEYQYLGDTWTWNGRTWSQQRSGSRSGPGPRNHASAVYDPTYPVPTAAGVRRGAILLFGGHNAGGVLGDTWAWSGTRWLRVPGAGPRARQGAGMVYDPVRKDVMLFGGCGSQSSLDVLGDTWTWDGGRWSPHFGPTEADAIAYDEASRQLVLFGDYDVERDNNTATRYAGNTWVWSGDHWTLAATQGPAERQQTAVVYDAWTRRLVLFGGQAIQSGGTHALGDTWTWDGKRWSEAAGPGPPARIRPNLVYDPDTHQVILFGGCCGTVGNLADTWTWDGTRWSPHTGPGPSPQEYAAMAYDPATHQVVLFDDGGAALDATWIWNGAGWTPAATTSTPTARVDAQMRYDPATRKLLLFGGEAASRNSHSQYFGDAWQWDGQGWTQVSTSGPAPRSRPSLAYSQAAGRLVLWGGMGAVPSSGSALGGVLWAPGTLADSWTWDGRRWTQVPGQGPTSFGNILDVPTPLVYDPATGQLVMFDDTRGTWTW